MRGTVNPQASLPTTLSPLPTPFFSGRCMYLQQFESFDSLLSTVGILMVEETATSLGCTQVGKLCE